MSEGIRVETTDPTSGPIEAVFGSIAILLIYNLAAPVTQIITTHGPYSVYVFGEETDVWGASVKQFRLFADFGQFPLCAVLSERYLILVSGYRLRSSRGY